ncbi:hypothetical protein OPT61_g5034 [Boeremia exigua]|uniref:Uncharacterized protein n=1 Tax=Boeremia exigua TaxID=749465 RepID=A0ACC2IBQ9_9PLEO|nr:hypothetical protein OPT61_g5034 [Boeremia exigua]
MTVSFDPTSKAMDHDDTSGSVRDDFDVTDAVAGEPTQLSPLGNPEVSPESFTQEQERASLSAKYDKSEHKGTLQLQDAVIATLFDASPDVLESFNDPMVSSFKAIFKKEKQLVIWRKGNALFIGIFENHTSMKVFAFEHLIGLSICYDGSWRILKSAGNAVCDSKWPEVWSGRYRCLGGVNRMVAEYEHMEAEKVQRASMLAAKILEGEFQAAKLDVKAV